MVAGAAGGIATAGFTFLSGGVPTPLGVAAGWAVGTWAGIETDELFESWGW